MKKQFGTAVVFCPTCNSPQFPLKAEWIQKAVSERHLMDMITKANPKASKYGLCKVSGCDGQWWRPPNRLTVRVPRNMTRQAKIESLVEDRDDQTPP